MKTLFVFLLSATFAHAIFSEHVILTPESDKKYSALQPTILGTEKNADFVTISIPFKEEGQSYWLVIATRPLEKKEMQFRGILWSDKIPGHIEAFVPLGEKMDYWETPPKRFGFIEVKIRKELLSRAYICRDYPESLDDGGYYFTYDLSKYPVATPGQDGKAANE